jgi:alcohol dehydrogenase (cytochrome c)
MRHSARLVSIALLALAGCAQTGAQSGGMSSDGETAAAQIAHGADVYAGHCASCHGANLEGKSALSLAGTEAGQRWQGQTAADLYQRVQTMPQGAPGSLPQSDYLAVTAFILDRNGNTPKVTLAADPAALKAIPSGVAAAKAEARLETPHPIGDQIAGGPTQAELTAAGPRTTDWLFTNHDYAGDRYVDLKQIDPSNAKSLRPVCMYQVGDMNPFPNNPIIYKGAMFITSRDSAFSLDAATCKLNWRYDRPSRAGAAFPLKMNRGAAIKDGKLVYGTHDGFLIALDAGTGKKLWERDVADPNKNEGGFTMAPMIYDDLVIIGPAGSELGVKGWLGAFRLSDGEPVWRFNTVPDDNEPGADTWPDHNSREHGGGAVWGSMTLDVAKGLLYVPVSNPTPDFDGDKRPGDNLYTCSIVVLDVRTGKLVWYYQVTPHDTHDYDLTQAGPQFSATIDGKQRNVVVAAGKEGIVHLLDRDTHQLLYQVPVTTRQNTDKPWIAIDVTKSGERVCPGAIGGIQWQGPAYNPGTKMLYVPAADWCLITKEPVEMSRGWLTAIDATTGKVAWRYAAKRPMLAAVTTTSAGVVFAGEITGDFLALDAKTGKVLYRFDTGGRITGGTPTYLVGGKQYVATVSGTANAFWHQAPGSSTVIVFALP